MDKKFAGAISILLSLYFGAAKAEPRLFVKNAVSMLNGTDPGSLVNFRKEVDIASATLIAGVERPFGSFRLRVWGGVKKNQLRLSLTPSEDQAGATLTADLSASYESAVSGLGIGWETSVVGVRLSLQAELPRNRLPVVFEAVLIRFLDLTAFARENATMSCDVVGASAALEIEGKIFRWWGVTALASGKLLDAQCGMRFSPEGERTIEAFEFRPERLRRQNLTFLVPFIGLGSVFRILGDWLIIRVAAQASLYPLFPTSWVVEGAIEGLFPLNRRGWRWK